MRYEIGPSGSNKFEIIFEGNEIDVLSKVYSEHIAKIYGRGNPGSVSQLEYELADPDINVTERKNRKFKRVKVEQKRLEEICGVFETFVEETGEAIEKIWTDVAPSFMASAYANEREVLADDAGELLEQLGHFATKLAERDKPPIIDTPKAREGMFAELEEFLKNPEKYGKNA